MAPILQELAEEYKDRVIIKIIEIDQESGLTTANRIRSSQPKYSSMQRIKKFYGMRVLWIKNK